MQKRKAPPKKDTGAKKKKFEKDEKSPKRKTKQELKEEENPCYFLSGEYVAVRNEEGIDSSLYLSILSFQIYLRYMNKV